MAFAWDTFFDAGGIAGVVSLLWQAVREGGSWRGRPKLGVLPFEKARDVRRWTVSDVGGQVRQVFTLEVLNSGKRTATRCVATLRLIRCPDGVRMPDPHFTLHWAGIDYCFANTGAQPVDIGSEHRRLDVAFKVQRQSVDGCWIAIPMALLQPGLHQALLPIGSYEVEILIRCENGRGVRQSFRLESPRASDDLSVVPTSKATSA
jgi:hypothetical protein